MIQVLDYFKLKPQFELPGYPDAAIYVEPGALRRFADPDQWDYKGPARHPSLELLQKIARDGFVLRRSSIPDRSIRIVPPIRAIPTRR